MPKLAKASSKEIVKVEQIMTCDMEEVVNDFLKDEEWILLNASFRRSGPIYILGRIPVNDEEMEAI